VSHKKQLYCKCPPGLWPKIYGHHGRTICVECWKRISEKQIKQNAVEKWLKAKGDNG